MLEIKEDDIYFSSTIAGKQVSLDTPISDDGDGMTLLDIDISPNERPTDHGLEIESVKEDINRMLSMMLSEREKTIIEHLYGLNGKQAISKDEIGKTMDLTHERIRQIKERAIKRLKRSSTSKLLKKYLE